MRKYQRIRNLREDKDMNQTQMARELTLISVPIADMKMQTV